MTVPPVYQPTHIWMAANIYVCNIIYVIIHGVPGICLLHHLNNLILLYCKTWLTRKSCSEMNTKAALRYRLTTILKLWYMMAMWSIRKQKFIDQLSCKIHEIVKKKKKGWLAAILNFLVWNLSWVLLVWDIRFCFIFMVQSFCISWV